MQFLNVALGKPCRQSSVSPWSQDGEAGRAVNGRFSGGFAFHTNEEDEPWWEVDLGMALPIRAIVVHNRADGGTETRMRASPLLVEGAGEDGAFRQIARYEGYFGSGRTRDPLTISLPDDGSEPWYRRVRLTVPRRSMLHLEQVEVFTAASMCQAAMLNERLGLRFSSAGRAGAAYLDVRIPTGRVPDRIDALYVLSEGRLGNRLIALVSAVILALRMKIPTLYIGGLSLGELVAVPASQEIFGLKLLNRVPDEDSDEIVLRDNFFRSVISLPDGAPAGPPHGAVFRELVRPLLFGTDAPDLGADDELVIHVRSGDIFGAGGAIDRFYVQPPLAYYVMCIAHAQAEAQISQVTVVFEDRRNPCVDALEAHLATLPLRFRMVSSSVADDARILVDARRVVGGHGTFVPALAAQSAHLRAVYFFRLTFFPWFFDSTRTTLYEVADMGGGFTQQGEWTNSAEQRAAMLTYPATNLAMRRHGDAT